MAIKGEGRWTANPTGHRNGKDIIPADDQPPKESTYVRFPLAALHSDKPLEEVPADEARRILQRCLAWHIATTKVDPAWFDEMIDDSTAIETLAAEVATTFGKQRTLFPRAFFQSAMDDWPYRKFAILAAIYASIGNYEYRVVTREKIAAGSVGFSNDEERVAFGSTFEPITTAKLRTTIDNLVTSQLIARAEYNGRTTAYSRPSQDIKQRIADRKRRRKEEAHRKIMEDIFGGESKKPKEESKSKIEQRPAFIDYKQQRKDAAFKRFMDSIRCDESEKPKEEPKPKVEQSATTETSEQRSQRQAEESFRREAEAEARRAQYRPQPQVQQPPPQPPKPPKLMPTPDEIEARRREIERLCEGKDDRH